MSGPSPSSVGSPAERAGLAEGESPLAAILALAPVVPVLVVERLDDAVPLAEALVRAGLPVLEVTLRTAVAWDAAAAMHREVPGAVVGVGTVTKPSDLARAAALGLRFAVSPGATPALFAAARAEGVPYLPGVATVSEAMQAAELGFTHLKLFPAIPVGGAALLRALHGPLPALRFCPTGGVSLANAPELLALPNVDCVGGSWMATAALVQARDWGRVEELAREAAGLRRG